VFGERFFFEEDMTMKRFWATAIWCLATLTAGAASPNPKDLVIPSPELSKARDLVRQLASESYKEREQAQDDLAKMGRLARPALTEALANDPSPEIRARTARLLPRAEAAELQARIDTFLADTDSKFEHDLPGWALFRKIVAAREAGSDKAVRDLYVEAIKTPANLELLTALNLTAEAAGRVIADRRVTLFLQQNPGAFGRFQPGGNTTHRPPSLTDIALLLFAESAIDGKHIPRPGPFTYISGAYLVQINAGMQNALNNPDSTPHGKAYRQIFVKWLDSRVTPDDLNNMAWAAQNFRQVKETGPLLHRIIKTDGVVSYAKAQAMVSLLQRSKDEMPAIRSQLKNDASLNRLVFAPNVVIESQVRDVALALILHSEGQDLKSFGFEFQPGFNVDQVSLNYWGYGFKTDADRAAAHKKFHEYEEKKKSAPKKDVPKK
jgi:hypothetical protein